MLFQCFLRDLIKGYGVCENLYSLHSVCFNYQGHQYETVSGFICEVFGYIPEEGAKIVVVLEKANREENSEYRNEESDGPSRNERHQKYEIEVPCINIQESTLSLVIVFKSYLVALNKWFRLTITQITSQKHFWQICITCYQEMLEFTYLC